MSRIMTAAIVVATLGLAASPAFAQSTSGTINITGSVEGKCTVAGGSYVDTVALAELSDANGTLRSDLATTTAATPAFSKSFTVACTGANVGVAVTSTAVSNSGVSAPSGYANAIDFTGRAAVQLVSAGGSSTLNVDDASNVAAATSASAGAGAYLANAAGNVTISGYAFNTPSNAILVAGSYAGQVVVNLTPAT